MLTPCESHGLKHAILLPLQCVHTHAHNLVGKPVLDHGLLRLRFRQLVALLGQHLVHTPRSSLALNDNPVFHYLVDGCLLDKTLLVLKFRCASHNFVSSLGRQQSVLRHERVSAV